jgi:hypothetical protein
MAPDRRPELSVWAAVKVALRKAQNPPNINWEDAKRLPWLEIKELPLSTYNRLNRSGTARALPASARTEDFMNARLVAVKKLPGAISANNNGALTSMQPLGNLFINMYVIQGERFCAGALLPQDTLRHIDRNLPTL